MVQRELKVRYKNSALGFLWSFINPLVTTLVMTVVFGVLLDNGVRNYSAYVLAAYLPFMFLQFSILDSAQSVLSAIPLIKKTYFPREILPLAAVISNFIHFLIGLGVFFLFLAFIFIRDPRVNPIQELTLMLPVLLLISLMLATGCSLIVSALNVYYEDVKYLASVFLYLLFFLCPIMYFVEQVANSGFNERSGGLVYKIYSSNPVAVLTVAYRKSLVAPVEVPLWNRADRADPFPMPWEYLAYTGLFSFAILVFGYWLFNRLKWGFVERP